ncbi:hypothetical protein ACFV98_02555 [Streptomyces violascens]|uniref:hypothetical protein n=1 Tax=Streptomyces violascens TaxID=67381 RepID=UPI0036590493
MRRSDFDASAPLTHVAETALRALAPVPAVPDAYGTAALFGDDVPVRAVTRCPKAQRAEPQGDALF